MHPKRYNTNHPLQQKNTTLHHKKQPQKIQRNNIHKKWNKTHRSDNMIIVLDDIKLLKTPINVISSTVIEAELQFKEDGLTINCIDKSHIIFFSLFIHKDSFRHYTTENETICLDMEELNAVLNKAKKDDSLRINQTDFKAKLTLTLTDEYVTKKYTLSTIEMNETAPRAPRIDNDTKVTLPSPEFKQYINDVDLKSTDRIKLITQADTLTIESVGLTNNNQIIIPLMETVEKDSKSIYDLGYINTILQATKYSDEVTIEYGDDLPLTVTYGDYDNTFKAILAPRIEEE